MNLNKDSGNVPVVFTPDNEPYLGRQALLTFDQEFVLMPDHIHLLLTPSPDITLERAVQLIKGGSARRISRELNFRLPVWQRGYTDHRIRDFQDYETHWLYIEANPVKAGLAELAQEYAWSSASESFVMDEPQGLKPLSKAKLFGTVEPVPLHRD
jgi:Transposase IS200 like